MADYVLDNLLAVFVIVRFPDHNLVTDGDVCQAMENEDLRPVTPEEFQDYRTRYLEGRLPERKLAAFGNECPGPSDQGSFPGTPYLDTDGTMKTIQEWTRGSDADQWTGDWGFLFYWQRH